MVTALLDRFEQSRAKIINATSGILCERRTVYSMITFIRHVYWEFLFTVLVPFP